MIIVMNFYSEFILIPLFQQTYTAIKMILF